MTILTYNEEFMISFVLWILILLGLYAMYNDKFVDMWNSASLLGKFFTCIFAIISLPGIIAYGLLSLLRFIFEWIRDLAFPRKSGYVRRIKYDENLYHALKEKKIYCEHWGQINLESSVIVFLCEKDYQKALNFFPDIENKIIRY